MLSFTVISGDYKKEIDRLCKGTSREVRDAVFAAADEYAELFVEGELEFAIAISASCLCTRVFDYGRYYFLAPEELDESAELKRAYLDVFEYAKREELQILFHEVPRVHFSELLELARHIDVDAEGLGGDSFFVRVKTECELLGEIPEQRNDEFTLRALAFDDARLYAELCRSEAVNANFGYSPTDEHPDASDEELVELALGEFERGVSVPLALEYNGSFIGDAVFYAFDGMGGAEIAMRILPDFQGRGIGSSFLEEIFDYAQSIGLLRVYSYVKKENKASVAMCCRFMDKTEDDGERILFLRELN